MANNLSDWSERALLDWLMGGSAPVRPAARYVGLFTAAPTEAGGGTEAVGGAYARQALVCGAADAGGHTDNTAALTFAAVGAGWGLVTHLAVFDALVGGNQLWQGPLSASRQMDDGDVLQFAIADLDFTLD